jgi:hypothetical protein
MDFIGKQVLVRTYSAGVHFGYLKSFDGKEIVLTDARRIWSWEGAFTLSAVAQYGVKSGKISTTVPIILLTEAIEVIPLSETAIDNLNSKKEYTP